MLGLLEVCMVQVTVGTIPTHVQGSDAVKEWKNSWWSWQVCLLPNWLKCMDMMYVVSQITLTFISSTGRHLMWLYPKGWVHWTNRTRFQLSWCLLFHPIHTYIHTYLLIQCRGQGNPSSHWAKGVVHASNGTLWQGTLRKSKSHKERHQPARFEQGFSFCQTFHPFWPDLMCGRPFILSTGLGLSMDMHGSFMRRHTGLPSYVNPWKMECWLLLLSVM